MGWDHLSIPKRQRHSRWSLGMNKHFHFTLYWTCGCTRGYISMLGSKLIPVNKRDPWFGCKGSVMMIRPMSTGYMLMWNSNSPLQWRHNGLDSVSNHQPHDCLLNGLFRRRSKKTSKLRVTGLCAGNSPVTGEFPAQMATNAENVSIWWRHHSWPLVLIITFFFGTQQTKICTHKRHLIYLRFVSHL